MADIALIVGLVAIFCAVVIALATVGVLTGEREQVGKSLAAIEAFNAAPASMRKELDKPFGERVLKPFLKESTGLGRRLTPAGQIERIRKRLDAAGSPTGWDVDRILAFKVLGALAGVVAHHRRITGVTELRRRGTRRLGRRLRRRRVLRAGHGDLPARRTTGRTRCARSSPTRSTC